MISLNRIHDFIKAPHVPWIIKPFIDRITYHCINILKYRRFWFFHYISIETSSVCNRRCTCCPVQFESRPNKFMDETLFKKIAHELAALKYTGTIFLHNYNEPLLDKRLPGFISYLRKLCPKADIRFNTNGDYLTSDILKQLITSGINKIMVTCYDGIIPNHIQEIIGKLTNIDKDYLIIRVNDPNDLSIWDNRAGSINKVSNESIFNMPCHSPSVQMVIDYAGKVPICCDDYFNKIELGNANDTSLIDIWNSLEASELRSNLRHGKRSNYSTCIKCDSSGSFY